MIDDWGFRLALAVVSLVLIGAGWACWWLQSDRSRVVALSGLLVMTGAAILLAPVVQNGRG